MLTIADKGGFGLKNFYKGILWAQKMWIESAIDLDFTIRDKQSHIKCKLKILHFII